MRCSVWNAQSFVGYFVSNGFSFCSFMFCSMVRNDRPKNESLSSLEFSSSSSSDPFVNFIDDSKRSLSKKITDPPRSMILGLFILIDLTTKRDKHQCIDYYVLDGLSNRLFNVRQLRTESNDKNKLWIRSPPNIFGMVFPLPSVHGHRKRKSKQCAYLSKSPMSTTPFFISADLDGRHLLSKDGWGQISMLQGCRRKKTLDITWFTRQNHFMLYLEVSGYWIIRKSISLLI